jgi:hypothetical protein
MDQKCDGHDFKVTDLRSYAWVRHDPRSATAIIGQVPFVNSTAEPSAYAAASTVNAGHERLRMRHGPRYIRRSLGA